MPTDLVHERATDAYARELWVRTTLADSLREAAQQTPQRVALIDGDIPPGLQDSPHAGEVAGAGTAVPDADGQRGVVHAAELA